MRKITALFLLLTLLVTGCASSSSTAGSPAAVAASATSAVAAAAASATTSGAAASDSACPTSNTTSFAKARFVADLGGAAFALRRYVYEPYKAGKFTKGASGRTVALVKATAAAASSVHLLKNAAANAKANPTLCKTIAGPLSSLITAVSGLSSSALSGGGSAGILGGLGGTLTGLLAKSGSGGVPVTETSPAAG